MLTPHAAAHALAQSRAPLLIGVRHHSPACAAAMGAWLDAFRPDRIFLELPVEFQEWVPWLAHADAEAPLALAAAGGGSGFYPFADFSPELVAVRWARAQGVPVVAFDLPVGTTGEPGEDEARDRLALPDWDELVERHGVGAEPEALRRAALAFGWALRVAQGARRRDLWREAHMRARLAALPSERPAVVTGAFHNAALVADAALDPLPRLAVWPTATRPVTTSLIPYRMDLLDDRTGYPAGIRDPAWHQRVYRCLAGGQPLEPMVASVLVAVCREIRAARHVAGVPDAAEALRLSLELAGLRGLSAPGRAEVLEAVESTLGQGERLGRGRILATALERVMVGTGRGRLAPGTPQSGLVPSVTALVQALRLPGPDDDDKVLRLDPLRSELDRRRHAALHRLVALGVPYGQLIDQAEDTLTHAWRVRWEPATEAALALAATFGPDLATATRGALLHDRPRESGDEGVSAAAELAWLTAVCATGLPDLAREGLEALLGDFLLHASLPDLVGAVGFVDRIARGHEPSLQSTASPPGAAGGLDAFEVPPSALEALRVGLYVAAVRQLDGLAGSREPDDVRALATLVRLATEADRAEDGRLGYALDMLWRTGTPVLSGAALVARHDLGRLDAPSLGAELGAAIRGAASDESRHDLGDFLHGAFGAAGPGLESSPALLDGIGEPIESLPDAEFLARLPALRHGFDALTTAGRQRVLEAALERHADTGGTIGPDVLDATLAALDGAARQALAADGLWDESTPGRVPALATAPSAPATPPAMALPPRIRWRLALGRADESMDATGARYAAALDELYGAGRGEGSRGDGGGRNTSFPTAREWGDELDQLFGESIRVDVAARAAERGDGNALLLLDPETVTPSVTLLEQALSLKGGLAEAQLETLRRLCRRITDQLVQALAVRVRPALAGLSTPRPTSRRTDRLHLRRTIETNLRTAHQHDGAWRLVPERLTFKSRARREMDWHVILVVDTSGSMESSVIHAAMMAAILSSLPAVSVTFLAFSDEVIDLTGHVDDPLALLLEVKIGGGTLIHRALRHARERATVPRRTLVVLVSDFEEGGSVGALIAEVRALAESGVTLLGLAALDDDKRPRFSEAVAGQVAAVGMPVAALSPVELARFVAEHIQGARA